MTVLPIGAVGVESLVNSVTGVASGERARASAVAPNLSLAEPAGSASSALSAGPGEQTTGAGALGEVGGVSGATETGAVEPGSGAGGTETGGGFGEALTNAISSLEQTQKSSDGAAKALATGTASNPESAVVTVEDAQLAMQLASQLRTKATEGVQQIFQTQV
ncbi:MAG TPA: flagellar hook-basal body complex protein FliE [Solirubrobacteraceae bacterium]|jgi:flagellar hook-basal body complex protein FliE|nr:flagellar hook-basal body complex protein FliE [Solirubrobacteraceae bacterium]